MMQVKSWPDRLRLFREDRGIRRADLASLCGVSDESLYSYESGRRRPARETLDRILDVLGVKTREADSIRYDMGFSTVTAPPSLHIRRSDCHQYLDEVPWPQMIQNSFLEILDVNNVSRLLISWFDQSREEYTRTSVPKQVLSRIICAAAFDRRLPYVVNLDEVLKNHISSWKYLHGPGSDELPPWLDECLDTITLVDKLKQRSGSLLARFLRLWEITPAMAPRARHYSRTIIASTDLGYMEFWAQTTLVDEQEVIYAIDMIPANAHTWQGLDAIKTGNIPVPEKLTHLSVVPDRRDILAS